MCVFVVSISFDSFVNSQAAGKAVTHLGGKFPGHIVCVCMKWTETKQFLDQTPYSTKRQKKLIKIEEKMANGNRLHESKLQIAGGS